MKNLIAVAVALGLALTSLPARADEATEAKGLAVSEAWLAVVDGGNYGQGWDHAAAYLKGAITRADFEQALTAVRGPLGAVVSRRLKTRRYMNSLPGAPDGQYVVIQYDTVFENKEAAVETITPMLDTDGGWRVAGYFIR